MLFLESLTLKPGEARRDVYPFVVPQVAALESLTFTSPVTFFVGENGTGKSTLLEAIAAGTGVVTVGGVDVERDESLAPARQLARSITFAWRQRTKRGFFMRAEDFFNFGNRMAGLAKELDELSSDYEERHSGYGLTLAQASAEGQRRALIDRYGEDLNARSHGESFFHLFGARFVPGGLYLLDEPDTALSPQRQLALVALLKDMVAEDSQFIIATHSPVLMAYPGATILSFDEGCISPLPYDQVEQVSLMRSFLNDPQAFLRHL